MGKQRKTGAMAAVLALCVAASGCSYMQQRTEDPVVSARRALTMGELMWSVYMTQARKGCEGDGQCLDNLRKSDIKANAIAQKLTDALRNMELAMDAGDKVAAKAALLQVEQLLADVDPAYVKAAAMNKLRAAIEAM